jgi:hypothetical protein
VALGEAEVLHEGGFGDFELDGVGRRVVLAQDEDDRLGEVFPGELDAGDIDGDGTLEEAAMTPVRGLTAGFVEGEVAEANDETGFFGERNEVGWRDIAADRVVPAHERLKADEVIAKTGSKDGLVVERELALADGAEEVAFGDGSLGIGGEKLG